MRNWLAGLLISFIAIPSFGQRGWEIVEVPGNILDMHATSDSLLGIVNSGNKAWISTNAGFSWDSVYHESRSEYSFTSVIVEDPKSITLFGGYERWNGTNFWHRGKVFTMDGGQTWRADFDPNGSMNMPEHLHVTVRTPERYFIGVHSALDLPWGAAEIKESISGMTVYSDPAPRHYLVNSLDIRDSTLLAIRSTPPQLLRSRNLGLTWDEIGSLLDHSGTWHSVRAGSGNDWWMTVNRAILKSRDTGSTWDTVHMADQSLREIQLKGAIGFTVVKDASYILATHDSGKTWFKQGIAGASDLRAVQILNDTIAYAFGPNYLIRTSSRGGTTTVAKSPYKPNWDAWPNPAADVIRVANIDLEYPLRFALISQLGVTVQSGALGSPQDVIRLDRLEPSVYYLEVGDRLGKILRKSIVVER